MACALGMNGNRELFLSHMAVTIFMSWEMLLVDLQAVLPARVERASIFITIS